MIIDYRQGVSSGGVNSPFGKFTDNRAWEGDYFKRIYNGNMPAQSEESELKIPSEEKSSKG
jgi:hypothetical protein